MLPDYTVEIILTLQMSDTNVYYAAHISGQAGSSKCTQGQCEDDGIFNVFYHA
jgi:hypothetical protein